MAFKCSECGSEFVMRQKVVSTGGVEHVIPMPVQCSNPECVFSDPEKGGLIGAAREVLGEEES